MANPTLWVSNALTSRLRTKQILLVSRLVLLSWHSRCVLDLCPDSTEDAASLPCQEEQLGARHSSLH